MPAADLLLAITQLAVALAGFSSLIAAIRTVAPDGWHPRDIWSLAWMFGASIGALVLGLLPLWLSLFDWQPATVYQVSSAVAAAYIGLLVVGLGWHHRRLMRAGHPPRVPVFPQLISVLLGAVALVLAVGTTGLLGSALVPLYVGSLITLLIASVLVLAVFLVLLARMTQR